MRLHRTARRLLGLVAAAALATAAQAQTSPGFVTGQIPTAAQWNSYFAGKQDYSSGVSCPISQGCTGQTAYSDGQLLIGDSSTGGLDLATLAAGTGLGVANGHGTITINFATLAANSLWGNATGSTAAPTAVSVPSCSGVSQRLNWIAGTGFVCGTSTYFIAGQLLSANFNSTADQAIALTGPATGAWFADQVIVTNCSTSLTTAKGGVYSAASKSGLVWGSSSTQAYTALSASNVVAKLSLPSISGTAGTGGGVYYTTTSQTVYLSLSTAQGGAATCDVYVTGVVL